MTNEETVVLVRLVKAACPQQAIDRYTPDAWHDLLGDLEFTDCKLAMTEVTKRKPFVAPSEIRAEVKRVRHERLRNAVIPPPPAELLDDHEAYQAWLIATAKRIADGKPALRAIGGQR